MPLKDTTYDMLKMLPPWMAMRNEESNGAKLLDPAGGQLEEIEQLITNVLMMATGQVEGLDANPLSIDYLYKIDITEAITDELNLVVIAELNGTKYTLTRSDSIHNFYLPGFEKFYFDTDTYIIYFRENFDKVTINDAEFATLTRHGVWNALDEIGLLLACPRLSGEVNADYQRRLFDVFQNPGNSTKEGMQNYISRSLGIEKENVIVESLYNENFINSLINEDGSIKDELKEYILISNKVNTFGIDTYWEILDETKEGLSYLPLIWDTGFDKWTAGQIQNGVGDTDDLEIIPPEQEITIQDFDYHVYAEGLYYPEKKVFPEHNFKYKVYATGQTSSGNGYKPEVYKYTVTASEMIPLTFDAIAHEVYQQNRALDFSGTTAIPSDISAEDRHPNDYIIGGATIVSGSTVPNTTRRYLQVLANLTTNNPITTPDISEIVVNYTAGGVAKVLKIKDETTVYTDTDGAIVVGFESNTWSDASPLIRVRNDTNDSYNTEVVNTKLVLGKGLYSKTYDSQGDWMDGLDNTETIGVVATEQGTLKLNVIETSSDINVHTYGELSVFTHSELSTKTHNELKG